MKKSRIVVYPGSFDPVTNGHLDIICRACQIFEHVIVAVTQNSTKSSLFTIDERLRLLNLVLAPVVKSGKVRVDSFSGLLADYCRQQGAHTVARGLRALSDFEYEFQMALMNRHLAPELETVFLMADEKYTYLSSSLLKDVVRLGGDASRFVPRSLVGLLNKKLRSKKIATARAPHPALASAALPPQVPRALRGASREERENLCFPSPHGGRYSNK